jgi:cytochrome c oxidase cbb3-type subunit 3
MTRRTLAVALLLATACEREQRRFSEQTPDAAALASVTQSGLQAGPRTAPPEVAAPYDGNAYAVSQGKQLYQQWNCVGCHAHGGGAIGPALMDDEWIYGSEPQNIYQTIVQGRPNGMPSFRDRIPSQQVWQLVSYVRSLAGLPRADVRTGRDDHMQRAQQEQSRKRMRPKASSSTPPPRD